ncbi:CCE_0567 family metalloprotein [Pseudaeromonas sp. ZJS20]|uniref:CCE_0567 family metalloprotein n=1 Tax=Pseudaeromonas aegiceratis TaxID=3153928 RepID=UPI00390CBA11
MAPEELEQLNKEVKRAKRIAAEKAGELHDLVEDGLPEAYGELLACAQRCYDACAQWAELQARWRTSQG